MLQHSQYKGLIERAAPGTHISAWNLLESTLTNRELDVLDLACGTGAFAFRLFDASFKSVSVTELSPVSFTFPVKEIYIWDLNQAFSAFTAERFGLITAIEIIEHLDSPIDFLRQIHHLLHKNGYLLLTTPNVQSIVSRLKFLLTGELKSFGPQDFLDQRHLHGLTDHQLKIFFDITGFELVNQTTGGTFYSPLKRFLLKPLFLAAKFLRGYLREEDVNIYLLRKSSPKTHLIDSATHYKTTLNR